MKLEIEVHIDECTQEQLNRMEQLLITINKRTEKDYKMTREEAKRLDTITNAIKTRMEALIAAHVDDLTPEEQAAVDEDFATLDSLGKDPAAPIA